MTTKLPQIPAFTGDNIGEVMVALKETLEVRVGRRGEALDAGVTFRDLTTLGVLQETDSSGSGQQGLSVRVPVQIPDGSIPELYDPAGDLTTPPAPVDLKASAVFETVYLSWSQPKFLNQSFWEVWKAFTNDLSSAVLAGTSSSQFFVDVASENSTLYYWVRTVSAAGIKSAWNSSFGTEVKTGIDPAKIIAVLEGKILESSLSRELASRIEVSYDQASATVKKLTKEVNDRIAAVSSEATARAAAIASEASARAAAITAEATARADAILAEATTRQAAITAEATTRQSADDSLASSITTLTASVNNNAAAIQNETTARVSGDAAEASERNILATQLRGGYTGNDLSALTTGLIYQERIARSTQDASLAQQITLLSAGSGDQFDWKAIWYFDSGIEGWGGNGTPTASAGYLRPANQASDAHVFSPTGLGVSGSTYGQARLRIRKVGNPTFAGFLWWRAAADSTWDTSRRVALTAPTFDGNGIGLIVVYPNWSVTVDRIRIDLSAAQTATDFFEIDWVALGRPAPGASSAQLLDEASARAAADSAEVAARETLATAVIGQVNPAGLTLSGLTTGLLYSERIARSSADSALASDINILSATVTNNFNTLNSSILNESTARANGDSAEATARNTLATQLRGSYTGTDISALTTGLIHSERVARSNADSALSSDISVLSSTVTNNFNTLNSAILNEATTRTNAISAEASARSALATQLRGTYTGTDVAQLSEGLVFSERTARSNADSALSSSITALSATVTSNFNTLNSAIISEQTARANGDSAEASARNTLAAQLRGSYTGTDVNSLSAGLIYEERVARANADSSLSSSITTLSSTVSGNTTSIQTLQTTTNGIQGKYTVKIDNNGHLSGFGLLSETNDGNTVSAFIIRADKFAIVDPASPANNLTNTPSADTVPFFVEGGVVYMKTAFIKDASISDAKIGSLSANKILAGNVNVAIGLNSASVFGATLYSGGTVTVNGDGSFTANNPTFAVVGGNVDIVSPNFRIKTLAAGGTLFTPFEVIGGVVYIRNTMIGTAAVGTANIADLSVTNAKILSLSADKINTGLLDAGLITIDGVTIDTYFDSSIGRNRLRIKDLAVTTAKMQDLSVTTGKIANLAVDTLKIAGNAITLPLTYTAANIYVNTAINKTSGGYNCSYVWVGYGNGDYEYDYDFNFYYFVGTGNGPYSYQCTNTTPTFTGAIGVIESPWINVGDATDGGAIIVFYATLDGTIAADAGQHIYMMLDRQDGNGYLIVAETVVGTRTSSGNTTSSIPMAMTYTANNVQNIRIKLVTGTRRVDLSPGTGSNPSNLKNVTLSVMGAKR